MLYRTREGTLIRCERKNYVTDKEYHRAIMNLLFIMPQTSNIQTNEIDKITKLVKTELCKTHKE